MNGSWVSLIPPILVIVLACTTHKLNKSLLCAIMSAAFIASQANVSGALLLLYQKVATHCMDIDNWYLYLLLVMISSLIVLLNQTGVVVGCARRLACAITTERRAYLSSIGLAFLLSIDDYLSILTVGFAFRPIIDRLNLSRAKLAYIVHALAGPLVILIPISTWAAAILVQLDNAGINRSAESKIVADSLYVYLSTIPFIFYSILCVASVFVVVVCNWWRESSVFDLSLHNNFVQDEALCEQNFSLADLFLPLGVLIGGVFMGVLYAGGFVLFGGTHSLLEAFGHNDQTFLVLCVSSIASFIVSFMMQYSKGRIAFCQASAVVSEGFSLMRSSIIMVFLASILGSFLRFELHTGDYIASLLLGSMPLFVFPAALFVVSLIVTLATGSAWGTFSLLIPICVQTLIALMGLEAPLSLSQIPALYPALGALLSGAACGNHISPFAETTVMTATSTGVDPLYHAKTQFPYALPIIVGTFCSFLLIGHFEYLPRLVNVGIALGGGFLVCCILLVLIMRFLKKDGI